MSEPGRRESGGQYEGRESWKEVERKERREGEGYSSNVQRLIKYQHGLKRGESSADPSILTSSMNINKQHTSHAPSSYNSNVLNPLLRPNPLLPRLSSSSSCSSTSSVSNLLSAFPPPSPPNPSPEIAGMWCRWSRSA
jgi:hypothetical protein